MFACSVTVRCPSDEAGSYYHLYFQKNKQCRARRTISIQSFDHVPLPMSACVLVKLLGGERRGMRSRRRRKGRGHTVGVMFGGFEVGYSKGLSCRWHSFGKINHHTCSGSDWISHPSWWVPPSTTAGKKWGIEERSMRRSSTAATNYSLPWETRKYSDNNSIRWFSLTWPPDFSIEIEGSGHINPSLKATQPPCDTLNQSQMAVQCGLVCRGTHFFLTKRFFLFV